LENHGTIVEHYQNIIDNYQNIINKLLVNYGGVPQAMKMTKTKGNNE